MWGVLFIALFFVVGLRVKDMPFEALTFMWFLSILAGSWRWGREEADGTMDQWFNFEAARDGAWWFGFGTFGIISALNVLFSCLGFMEVTRG